VFVDDDGVIHVFITGKACGVVTGGADNFPVFVAHFGGLLADGAFLQLLFGVFPVEGERVVAVLTDRLEEDVDFFGIGVVGESCRGDQDG